MIALLAIAAAYNCATALSIAQIAITVLIPPPCRPTLPPRHTPPTSPTHIDYGLFETHSTPAIPWPHDN